ncbi:hypothetical protein Pan153_32210 [Gimesia panareensis]|uniref:Response regulatory domain-containing protein n=1 Tax=Gimesia panareensis TaxID=2527978 RepID=A0A518FQD4_9PLAN|nr:response regulator [Gimesia panareensis]QDV18562.1 hypothetical protein Pan153_32210 [Gimesia panareensis]
MESIESKPKLLFVDDDRYFTERYVRHLETRFDIVRIHYAGDVLKYVEEDKEIKIIILDIMMPTPKGIASSATADGMDTGLWLLQELNSMLCERRIPILIYTNRKDTDVVQERVDEMKFPNNLVRIATKRRPRAQQLPEVAFKHLSKFNQSEI